MLLAAGQRMLNEQIRASTALRERMRSLEGKRFAVEISGTDLRIVVEAKGGEMQLSFGGGSRGGNSRGGNSRGGNSSGSSGSGSSGSGSGSSGTRESGNGDVDVELKASAIDLIKLARSATLTDLKGSGAKLNGDLDVAESFADVLRLALPEPEGALADWIGDMPAHAVAQVSRGMFGFTRRAQRAFEQNVAEYLQEESPTLIPPALASYFADEVDRLRDDVERAQRRVELLERRLAEQRRAERDDAGQSSADSGASKRGGAAHNPADGDPAKRER
jgi:ubiquinone biosynthesis protein UbiJ